MVEWNHMDLPNISQNAAILTWTYLLMMVLLQIKDLTHVPHNPLPPSAGLYAICHTFQIYLPGNMPSLYGSDLGIS